jgi:hypothetical protein
VERVEIACDVDRGLSGSKPWSETLGQRARASDKDEGKKRKEVGSFHWQMLGKTNSPVRLPGLTGEDGGDGGALELCCLEVELGPAEPPRD